MPLLENAIVVYDFETDGVDSNVCQPIQIAAVVIKPHNLDYYKTDDGKLICFNSLIRPDLETFDDSSIRIHKKTREMLENAPLPEVVWKDFARFVRQFNLNGKNDGWSSPLAAGFNINNYDANIVQRLCEKYKIVRKDGKQGIFNNRLNFDVMQMTHEWLWWSREPKSLSLDSLREYFGIDKEGAHDALKDVKDTGDILIKYLGLTEQLGRKIKFKNCFTANPETVGV